VKNALVLLAFFALLLAADSAQAQCAMCTKTAMDAMKDGNTASLGLNNAILYLLGLPYLLVMTIGGLWWYRKRRLDRVELG
jgi:LPXTG-motif cell wall-anchored protein